MEGPLPQGAVLLIWGGSTPRRRFRLVTRLRQRQHNLLSASLFQQSGLGPQVQSWLAGGNVSITPQQVEAALGSDQVKQLAQHFGVDPDAALKLLAQHLPAVVGQSGAAQS